MDVLNDIQVTLFQQIKNKIPPNVPLVHEVAELLEISYDSAYRRIRCETSLTFNEIRMLSEHYGISIDGFIKSSSDIVGFKYKLSQIISSSLSGNNSSK